MVGLALARPHDASADTRLPFGLWNSPCQVPPDHSGRPESRRSSDRTCTSTFELKSSAGSAAAVESVTRPQMLLSTGRSMFLNKDRRDAASDLGRRGISATTFRLESPPGPSPSRASRNSSANPPHSRPGDRSARPNHELHLRIDDRVMRFKSRSRRISVWNSTAPRWARKVMNRRYARSVCAWRSKA